MTYTVSSGTLNPSIPYHSSPLYPELFVDCAVNLLPVSYHLRTSMFYPPTDTRGWFTFNWWRNSQSSKSHAPELSSLRSADFDHWDVYVWQLWAVTRQLTRMSVIWSYIIIIIIIIIIIAVRGSTASRHYGKCHTMSHSVSYELR